MVDFTVRYVPTVDPQAVTQRIIRNPNYTGHAVQVPGCVRIPIKERAMKPKFFEALEKNVALDGFRNPILLYATTDGLLLSFGGSRLRVAKRLDKEIPAIVVDYAGDFQLFEEVTEENFASCFTDVPELFVFTEIGVDTHYSLERNRREYYDPKGMVWAEGLDSDFIEEEFPWLS